MSQILEQKWHTEPINSLVERIPVEEDEKLSQNLGLTWEDLRGLSWTIREERD